MQLLVWFELVVLQFSVFINVYPSDFLLVIGSLGAQAMLLEDAD